MISRCKNRVELIGHVGTDIQKIHENPTGARFRLATNEMFFSKKKKQFVTQTEWHSIKCWKQNAEFSLKNIKKGDYIYIEGKIHYYQYIVNGERRINPEIITNDIIKLKNSSSIKKLETNNELIPDKKIETDDELIDET